MPALVRLDLGRDRRVLGAPRWAVGTTVLALLIAGVATAAPAAAAVPSFPDNLVVFPDRDFVTVEGYQDHVGETATLQVVRGGTVVGSARAVVAAGDVAFEVNHPGGSCWGAGTNLKVTPDIVAGDRVEISFVDGTTGETTVSDAAVTADSVLDGSTVRITGRLGTDVNRAQLEQRVVNPDLLAAVDRRDIRAVPGPVVSDPRGVYRSGLDIAADGSFSALRPASDKTQVQVNWTPATPLPGAAAVTGYSVSAIGAAGGDGHVAVLGARTSASATRATLTSLDVAAGYTYEVRSLVGTQLSEPFAEIAAAPVAAPPADQTVPALTITPAPGADPTVVVSTSSVTAVSESGADLYYAVDGPASTGDLPSDAARLYTGPIPVTAQVSLHFAAFDRAGNLSTAAGTYAPPAKPAAAPVLDGPSGVTAAAGQLSAIVRWNGVSGATGYEVVSTGAGASTTVKTTATTAMLSGLTAGTGYTFTVASRNTDGVYGTPWPATAAVTPTPVVDRVVVTSARWKAGDFRIVGTGTAVGATVSIRTGSATGPVIGTAVVTAPVAPATVGDYSVRLRNAAAGTRNPGQIWVTSNNGGAVGPVAVVNG